MKNNRKKIHYLHYVKGSEYKTNRINEIIFNEKSHIVSCFKEYLISDECSEFLKKIYKKTESKDKLIKMLDYYCCHSKIFPNYTLLKGSKYIYRSILRKQRIIDEINNKQKRDQSNQHKEKPAKIFDTKLYQSLLNETNQSHNILTENIPTENCFQGLIGGIEKAEKKIGIVVSNEDFNDIYKEIQDPKKGKVDLNINLKGLKEVVSSPTQTPNQIINNNIIINEFPIFISKDQFNSIPLSTRQIQESSRINESKERLIFSEEKKLSEIPYNSLFRKSNSKDIALAKHSYKLKKNSKIQNQQKVLSVNNSLKSINSASFIPSLQDSNRKKISPSVKSNASNIFSADFKGTTNTSSLSQRNNFNSSNGFSIPMRIEPFDKNAFKKEFHKEIFSNIVKNNSGLLNTNSIVFLFKKGQKRL